MRRSQTCMQGGQVELKGIGLTPMLRGMVALQLLVRAACLSLGEVVEEDGMRVRAGVVQHEADGLDLRGELVDQRPQAAGQVLRGAAVGDLHLLPLRQRLQ